MQDVIDILRNLSIQKSPGPDTIHPAVLNECRDELANPHYSLFKASLITGKIPFDWKTGHISQIVKKGDRALAEVMDQWTQIMDNGGTVDITYLDFAKAFDAVPHRRLLQKLEYFGIKGKVLK